MTKTTDESPMATKNFFGMSLADVERHCLDFGVSVMHARDLFRSAYKDGLLKPWTRPGIPLKYSGFCERGLATVSARVSSEFISQYDGSVKFIVELSDGRMVEMVLMPEAKRLTLCVSSQVGCAQACVFCHTGRMGLIRNLDVAEIVGQVWLANQWIASRPEWLSANRLPGAQRVTNIVFMGMGEPLDNVDAVARAITILCDPYGLNLAKRRVSVSTAGHLDGLREMVKIHPDVRLAISVHSAVDSERSKIMPINRRWPLESLVDALRDLPTQRENGLLLQYTLISGVNDSIEHARKLADLISGLNVKINIIPLNPVGPSRLKGPSESSLVAFRDEIYKSGHRVMVRYSKGQDIAAACGQLVAQINTPILPQ